MEDTGSRRNSITTRLTLIVGGALAAAVLVVGGMALFEQQQQLTRALETKAASLAQFMAQVSPISVLSLNFVDMNNNVKKIVLTDDEAVYAIIANDKGIPLAYYLTDTDSAATGEVRALWTSRNPLAAAKAMKQSSRILEVEAPIKAGEQRIGSVIVGFSFDRMHRALMMQIALIGTILVVVTGASLFLLTLALRKILQPVQALTSAATQISTGDLNVVLAGTERRDELGVLSRAFGSMATQLRGLIDGMEQRMSELQRAQEALRESEQRYRMVFENSPISIWEEDFSEVKRLFDGLKQDGVSDIETYFLQHPEIVRQCAEMARIVAVNRAALALHGARSEQDLLAGIASTFTPESFDTFMQELICLWNGGTMMTRDAVVKTLAGEPRHVTVYFSVCPGYEETLEKVIVSLTDISERKRTEEALRLSSERLQLATRVARIGIWDWDIPKNELMWDDSMYQLYGIKKGDFGGAYDAWINTIHPEDKAHTDGEIQAALRGEREYAPEFRIVRPDGSIRHIKAESHTTRDREGKPLRMIGTNIDITEHKQAEVKIRMINQELEQRVAERTAQLETAVYDLENFNYSASHDLRIPLRAVDGFSRILLDEYSGALDAEGMRLLQVVRDNTKRMAQYIEDMLTFSSIGRMVSTPAGVDMEALAKEVVDELEPSESGRELIFKIGKLPSAFADQSMMRRVMVNLLANAIKFTRPRPTPLIEVGAKADSGETVYYVRDNGVGFDMRYADKLFGVFQRLHSVEEFEGNGIGLAIVKRIITRHGGRVWAEGKVGEGATFYFALPAH